MKHQNIFFLIFLSLFLNTTIVFAQTTKPRMKLVFPFGDPQTQSVCPLERRTVDTCCPEVERIYTYSDARRCCQSPNELLSFGALSGCCPPWKSGQPRWGRTESSICGGYCAPVSQIVTAGGYSSCCSDCALVDGVRAFESAPLNVCGTCCSRIPESCGNAGIRLCHSDTGSAYCSKLPDKCNDADDWMIGSHGEGGYHCCAKCTGGVRFGNTNSSCGTCCLDPNIVLTYSGSMSCCSSVAYPQTRWGQTSSSVCGGYCGTTSVVSIYSGISSCCSNCANVNGITAFQSSTNVCGTCCSRVPESCGNAGERVCAPGTGSAYCSSDKAKCTPPTDWIIGTSGEGGFTCCPSCSGTRFGHTSSTCGSCCLTGSLISSFNGSKSCCSSCNGTIINQTQTNICGTCCPVGMEKITYGGKTSCCSSCFMDKRTGQTAANPCGTCCDIMHLTGYTNGSAVYTSPLCSCPAGTSRTKVDIAFGLEGGYACCKGRALTTIFPGCNGTYCAVTQSFTSAGTPIYAFPIAGCEGTQTGTLSYSYYGNIWGYTNLGQGWGNINYATHILRISYYDNGKIALFQLVGDARTKACTYRGTPIYHQGKYLGDACYSAKSVSFVYTNNSKNISVVYTW